MAEKRTIDWASAEVKDGVLLAPLTGASSKDWSERFEGALRLLEQSNGAWGGVGLSKKAIEVKSVQPRAERDLHHLPGERGRASQRRSAR
jgi:hypothetical protein